MLSEILREEFADALAKKGNKSAGVIDNPKFNPPFREGNLAPDRYIARNPSVPFYSPIESAIENAPISASGTRGENIEAFVRKRAPKIEQSELDFSGLSLEPRTKYTRAEALGSLGDTGRAEAHVLSGYELEGTQRIDLRFSHKSLIRLVQRQLAKKKLPPIYWEMAIDYSKMIGDGTQKTHYTPNTIAHARYSKLDTGDLDLVTMNYRSKDVPSTVRTDDAKILLVEELQSDITQHLATTKLEAQGVNRAANLPELDILSLRDISKQLQDSRYLVDEIIDTPEGAVADSLLKAVEDSIDAYQSLETRTPSNIILLNNTIYDVLLERVPKKVLYNVSFDPTRPEAITEYAIDSLAAGLDYFKSSAKIRGSIGDIGDALYFLSAEIRDATHQAAPRTIPKIDPSKTPITKTSTYVRQLLQALFVQAKDKGLTEVVIPPVQAFADVREGISNVSKGSAFHNTYVTALNKAIKMLKGELGDQITVGKRLLGETHDGKPMIGTSINIEKLDIDPRNVAARFYKGGLMQRSTQ
jgi:hypothetical protein